MATYDVSNFKPKQTSRLVSMVFGALCEASSTSLTSQDVLKFLLERAISSSHAHSLLLQLSALRWRIKQSKDIESVLMKQPHPPPLQDKDKAQRAIEKLLFRGQKRLVSDSNTEIRLAHVDEWCRLHEHRRIAAEALANALKQTLQTPPGDEMAGLLRSYPFVFELGNDTSLLRSIVNSVWSTMLSKGKLTKIEGSVRSNGRHPGQNISKILFHSCRVCVTCSTKHNSKHLRLHARDGS